MESFPTELEIQQKTEIENFKLDLGIDNTRVSEDSDSDYNMQILSPTPLSDASSIQLKNVLKMEVVDEVVHQDKFILRIRDLQELALYLQVDFNKLLMAVIRLKNKEKLQVDDDDEDITLAKAQVTDDAISGDGE